MRYLLGITKDQAQGESSLYNKLQKLLKPSSKEIVTTHSLNALLSYLAIEEFDAIWVNWDIIGKYYIKFHSRLSKINKKIPLVIIYEDDVISGDVCMENEMLFSIYHRDDIEKKLPSITSRIRIYNDLKRSLSPLHRRNIRPNGFGQFVGNSTPMLKLYSQIVRVSGTDFTVLIMGESGSGKEIVAKNIHNLSHRNNFPFVSLNCAAIPDNLLESELFGYEKGAFTGAQKAKEGKFEIANNGTVFLDEIGDLAVELQAKLLRVLEDHTIERLGSVETKKINIRLLAATNKDLFSMTQEGIFREDLYHRLNVIPFQLLPVNRREDDIQMLIFHLIGKLTRNTSIKINSISTDLVKELGKNPLKGNVRELENLLTRLIFYSNSSVLTKNDLLDLDDILKVTERKPVEAVKQKEIISLKEMEKNAIEKAMVSFNGNITKVANALKISRVSLYKKIKDYGLNQ